ncbi:hypothetical protein D3C76_1266840 [compost metagenome]
MADHQQGALACAQPLPQGQTAMPQLRRDVVLPCAPRQHQHNGSAGNRSSTGQLADQRFEGQANVVFVDVKQLQLTRTGIGRQFLGQVLT